MFNRRYRSHKPTVDNSNKTPEELDKDAYMRVIGLLSRRDYSCYEINQKLSQWFDQRHIDFALAKAAEQGYQSDERFAESYLRSKSNQGYGEYRVTQGLKQKGVASDLIQLALESQNLDWFALALEVYTKKYREPVGDDYKLKSKRLRFMVTRGFSHEQARYAMDTASTEDEF